MITIMSNIYILVSVRYGEVFLIPCIFILYPVLIPKYLQTEGSRISFWQLCFKWFYWQLFPKL